MKISRQTSSMGPDKRQSHKRTDKTDEPLLPHEQDQDPQAQQEGEPREVGKQGYQDVQGGLEDTDRWGGDDYQERTQNDAITNTNSAKRPGKRPGK